MKNFFASLEFTLNKMLKIGRKIEMLEKEMNG